MFANNFMTIATLFACLMLLSCGDGSHGNPNDGEWTLLTESSLLHTLPFEPVKFFNGNNGIAIQGVSIQRTADSGKSWTTEFHNETKSVAAGIFLNDLEGWVVGNDNLTKPLVLKTTDGGKRWVEVPFDEKSTEQLNGKFNVLWDICFDPRGTAWVTGEEGLLQLQANEEHLRLLSMFPTGDASDRIACSDSGDVWALGRRSSVFRFRDGWVKKELDPKYFPVNIRSFGPDVWVVGKDGSGNGILLQSRDSGESWKNKAPRSAKALSDLSLTDGVGWLVGAEGHIYHTTDNGETWTKSKSPTSDDLLHIYSLNPKNVWITGHRETVMKYGK